uniref:Ig-like domain-containing protein n=1 Tax=Ursus maritimus TaxID=29073 RepID=A0A452TZQ9_URSMA
MPTCVHVCVTCTWLCVFSNFERVCVHLCVRVFPARIVNISSPVTVNEGGSVNLLCLAVGRPEPTVTWRQLRDGFTSEGEILEISDIQRGQAGEYECVTHNGVNSAPDSRRVLVTVNCEPLAPWPWA